MEKCELTVRGCCVIVTPSRWKFNGQEIDMDSNYNLVEGNLLIKRPQASQHGGIYQCIATNAIGTIVSREARVQFACKQHFNHQYISIILFCPGGRVLHCL